MRQFIATHRRGDKLRLSPGRIASCLAIWAACSVTFLHAETPTPSERTSARPTAISPAEAKQFVNDYFDALSRSDIAAVTEKFADTVNYQDEGERERAYIKRDLIKYITQWPVRTLKPQEVISSVQEDGRIALTFRVVYAVEDEHKKQRGVSINTWTLQQLKGQLRIVSQSETDTPDSSAAPADKLAGTGKPDETGWSQSAARAQKRDVSIEVPTATSAPKAMPIVTAPRKKIAPEEFAVALDIGHSPLKGGAVSARGVFEYKFNRRLVDELFRQLRSAGFARSFIINPAGQEIRLAQRAIDANEENADLFLAIHHDSVKDSFLKNWEFEGKTQKYCDDFHGYSIFLSTKNAQKAESLKFASKLGQALLDAKFTPTLHHAEQENRPVIDRQKGIYAFDDLIVLKTAKMPAVLLECGVIVNRAEEEKLNDSSYRKQLITAIIRAVREFSQSP